MESIVNITLMERIDTDVSCQWIFEHAQCENIISGIPRTLNAVESEF